MDSPVQVKNTEERLIHPAAAYSMSLRIVKWVLLSILFIWLVMSVALWKSNQHELHEIAQLLTGQGAYAEKILHDVRELLTSTLSTVVGALALLSIILAVLVFVIVHKAMQPLAKLSLDLQNIGLKMGQQIAVPSQMPAELQPIFEAVNGYIRRIDASMVREKAFISHASHELKTPITAILAQAQLLEQNTLLKDSPDADDQTRPQQQLLLSAKRLARLVEQLLTLAQVEHLQSMQQWPSPRQTNPSSPAALSIERIFLPEFVRETVAAELGTSPLSHELDVQLEPMLNEGQQDEGGRHEALWVYSNRHLLTLMLNNLIRNAFKYTPDHGRVAIYIDYVKNAPAPKTVALRIVNECAAHPQEDWHLLGQPFFRGQHHAAAIADIPGSGLGLAICQETARALNLAFTFGFKEGLSQFEVRIVFGKNSQTIQE